MTTDFITITAAYLSKIPEAIWGVLIGSLLTLFGTWQANKHSRKMQGMQFEYESKEQQRDRQFQMRKEVYLTAATAVVGATACIGKIANLKVTNEELEKDFHGFSVAITQIQMIANENTLKEVSKIYREYLKVFMKLFRDRYPLLLRQSDIELANKLIGKYQEEQERYLELMKVYNLEGQSNEARWNSIMGQSELATKCLNEKLKEIESLHIAQLAETLDLTQQIPQQLEPLMELQAKSLSVIRSELELTDCENILLEELRITSQELKGEFHEILKRVESSTSQPVTYDPKP